jgi:hypothetical protein
MKTWDDIKRETEKGARKLWADDEEYSDTHSDTLSLSKHATYSENNTLCILQNAGYSDTRCPSENSDSNSGNQTRSVGLENSKNGLSTSEHTQETTQSVGVGNVSEFNTSEYKKSYSEAVSTLKKETTHYSNPENNALCPSNLPFTVPGHVQVGESSKPCLPDSDSPSFAVPGDPIGIRSIQSIMMSATQMNLSHFHTAGMSSSLGQLRVPSAAEAMNSTYTKNNTSMKFTMHSENNSLQSTFEQLRYIRKKLVGASLGHFVRRIGSNLTGLNDRENIWYSALSEDSLSPSSTEVPRVLLRFYIDFNKMYNHGLTLKNLAQEVFGSDCQWNVSPDFMGMIDISVPPDTYYISQWLSRTKNRVCGTSHVLSCDSEPNYSLGHSVSEYITRGTNVLAACKIPGVDNSTLKLNNVISVEKNFGIEAAANILAELTGNVIISDFMARTGTVLPFSKHSSEVSSKGLLTSMGFERPKDDIQREIGRAMKSRSARLGHSELHVESVYEHIITGKDPPSSFRILT